MGMAAEAFEDIAQVGEGVDTEPLARADEAGQHGRGPSSVVAAQKRPISSTYSDPAQTALGAVIVDLQIAILENF